MAERTRHEDPYTDVHDEGAMDGEHLDSQVQKAQEQIYALKRQQELIERQKRELEELSRRQEQLHVGKTEMMEKLTRAIVIIERQSYDAQKRVETLHAIDESFHQHLDLLDSINPKNWEGLDLNKELTKALSAVDDSRAEYNRSIPKISHATDSEGDTVAEAAGYQLDYGGESSKDFGYWLKAGFAFTLPLVAVGLILILVILASLR
ncbi:MAG: hypothetical protein JWL90_2826 [Chthoniobacteraceae bacterium]|nr:hypothetical protein [Chthoniobacteraceae bacterium]